MATPDYNNQLDLALADLAQQDKPSFLGTSKRYDVSVTTLRDRFLGKQSSRQAATSIHHKNRADAEEEALISLINRLTNRGLPPTQTIVKNPAGEMIQRSVSKNWAGQFVARQRHRLTSGFLRNIDKERVKSEYAPIFQQLYDRVSNPCMFCNFYEPKSLIYVTVGREDREIQHYCRKHLQLG